MISVPITDHNPPPVSRTRILLGLSAVATGLKQIECGQVADGMSVARHGLEFLRGLVSEEART